MLNDWFQEREQYYCILKEQVFELWLSLLTNRLSKTGPQIIYYQEETK